MEAAVPPALAAALRKIWEKYLPRMEERLAALDAAAAALEQNTLTPEQCAAAGAAAHKLAGVLGSFGLTRGTDLAREAEIFCGSVPEQNPAAAAQVRKIARELRAMVEAKKRES